MPSQPLVHHSKENYQWIWIISLVFVALIFIFKLPSTHFIVNLFRFWEIISLFIILLHPYTILKTICQTPYTFGIPLSKNQLLLRELKMWGIALLLYLVVMYGLSIGVEFVDSVRPSVQQSFMMSQLYRYGYITFLVELLVLQGMAVLILNSAFGINYRLLMTGVVIYNFVMLVAGSMFRFSLEEFGVSSEIFIGMYALISCIGSLYCFRFIERLNQ